MIKKKYIKRAYIEEVICDKCGHLMHPTGYIYLTSPPKYPYICSNEKCLFTTTVSVNPESIKYEFEDDVNENCGLNG